MSLKVIVLIWALIGLLVTIVLVAQSRRSGREKAAGRLVVFGLVVLAMEEPLLTLFWVTADPQTDRYGLATVATESTRAHVLDSATFGSAFFVLLGWIALTAFRRGERWAKRALLAGWVLVAATTLLSALAIYSRGVPVPTAGGNSDGAGYGWEQVLVGLLSWGSGLWLLRSARPAAEVVLSEH